MIIGAVKGRVDMLVVHWNLKEMYNVEKDYREGIKGIVRFKRS